MLATPFYEKKKKKSTLKTIDFYRLKSTLKGQLLFYLAII